MKFFCWEKKRLLINLKIRYQAIRSLAFKKNVLAFLVFMVVTLVTVGAARTLTKFFVLKDYSENKTQVAENLFLTGIQKLGLEDYKAALVDFGKTRQTIGSLQQDIEAMQKQKEIGFFFTTPPGRSAKHLLQASDILSQAIFAATDFLQLISEVNISFFGFTSKQSFSQTSQTIGSRLNTTITLLSSALEETRRAKSIFLTKNHKEKIQKLEIQLKTGLDFFKLAAEITEAFTQLLEGEKTYLVLFANENELRPNGGFPGTYARVLVRDGKFEKFEINSIYDLDGQLKTKIFPPHPILNVNNRWYIRDSNWFVNYPDSAKKIKDLYTDVKKENLDGVITITSSVLKDILELTGPVYIKSLGKNLDHENSLEIIQAFTTRDINPTENKPKQLIADIVPLIFEKLNSFPRTKKLALTEKLQKALNQKNIIFWFDNPNIQSLAKKYNFDGSVQENEGDYLQINSANLGGTKTDHSIQVQAKLDSTFQTDKKIINRLVITRTNKQKISGPATENLSYLRLLVPYGSKIISSHGFEPPLLEQMFFTDPQLTYDPQVTNWEKNIFKLNQGETFIGKESGKTFFSGWQKLQAGESKNIEIVYELPIKITRNNSFSLLWQKQPGSGEVDFFYDINTEKHKTIWSNFKPKTSQTLDKDKLFAVIFKK